MATTLPSADEIQREMRRVRAELGDDVQDLVAKAQVLTDWQQYVRAYPWLCVGAAAVVGYFIVPYATRGRLDASSVRDVVQQLQTTTAPPRPGLLSLAGRMGLSLLLQQGLALAAKQFQAGLPSGAGSAAPGESHD